MSLGIKCITGHITPNICLLKSGTFLFTLQMLRADRTHPEQQWRSQETQNKTLELKKVSNYPCFQMPKLKQKKLPIIYYFISPRFPNSKHIPPI